MVIMQCIQRETCLSTTYELMGYTSLEGVLRLFVFLGEGLQPGVHFVLFIGKWAYNWGIYMRGKEA